MAEVIAFDVNETLLDLRALDKPFQELFGSAAVRQQWFTLMLQLVFVGGLTGSYVDYTTAQRAALNMLARREGVPLTDEEAARTVELMSSLPPHPEVPAALARLADSPLRVVTLTNSVERVGEAQLRNAGIRDLFDRVISADSVRRLKPAPRALPQRRRRLRHRARTCGWWPLTRGTSLEPSARDARRPSSADRGRC